jgi:hypothetical protein
MRTIKLAPETPTVFRCKQLPDFSVGGIKFKRREMGGFLHVCSSSSLQCDVLTVGVSILESSKYG